MAKATKPFVKSEPCEASSISRQEQSSPFGKIYQGEPAFLAGPGTKVRDGLFAVHSFGESKSLVPDGNVCKAVLLVGRKKIKILSLSVGAKGPISCEAHPLGRS